jgi:hypothetical protein
MVIIPKNAGKFAKVHSKLIIFPFHSTAVASGGMGGGGGIDRVGGNTKVSSLNSRIASCILFLHVLQFLNDHSLDRWTATNDTKFSTL